MRVSRWMFALVALAGMLGCSRTVGEVPELDAGTEAGEGGSPPIIRESDKLDVLFVVDNTLTAWGAQLMLAGTIPYLLERLVEPSCTNGLGEIVAEPPNPTDPCPVGRRDFAPLTDVHLAVISTSIGGHGADSCSPVAPDYQPMQNDQAHLLDRSLVGGVVDTYDGLGFLAWDPGQDKSPPGESDRARLEAALQQIVAGVGRHGCGFEAQLESMYRFLVEPDPYETIVVEGGSARPQGTDTVLLSQRAAFLRPDSVVLVVLLTDENDCSTRDGGQYYFSNQATQGSQSYHLPRARSECEISPNDPCCASCAQPPPDGCPASSPACELPPFDAEEDPINLRCFDQKRRFGIDFLYPIDRYVDGFTNAQVADREGNVQANPLFVKGRQPGMIVVAGIVGVPWQDIARSPTNVEVGYVPAAELDWSMILPDAAQNLPPTDPLMIEAREPRAGVHPVTGEALAPPTADDPKANSVNGHEHAIAGELQYACTYPLPIAQQCVQSSCECVAGVQDTNPICQAVDGSYGAIQYFGRATPAIRQLKLLRELAAHAVVASICADQVRDSQQRNYGYRPAVDAMMRELGRVLVGPEQ